MSLRDSLILYEKWVLSMGSRRQKPRDYRSSRQPIQRYSPDDSGTTGLEDRAGIPNPATPIQPEKVPPIDPVLRGQPAPSPVTWDQLKQNGKIIAGITSFVIVVVIPAVHYLTRLYSSVETVQSDVKDIKVKTEKLSLDMEVNRVRLESIEKSLPTQNPIRAPGSKQP